MPPRRAGARPRLYRRGQLPHLAADRTPPRGDALAVIVPSLDLAYFPVPKNACSTLKIAFYEINEGRPYAPLARPDGTMVHVHEFPGYDSLPLTPATLEATAALSRIAVVRDPLRRLVSCYKNRVLHFRELSTKHLPTEAFARAGLPQDPAFDLFIERLDEYRALSWSISHHSDLQRTFLGEDRGAFEQLFTLAELPRLEAWLRARAGRDLQLPHAQRGGQEFPDPEITPETRRRMLDYCAPDLGLWWDA